MSVNRQSRRRRLGLVVYLRGGSCARESQGSARSALSAHCRARHVPSRRRDSQFADAPSASRLKRLLKGEGGCSKMTFSPMATHASVATLLRSCKRCRQSIA